MRVAQAAEIMYCDYSCVFFAVSLASGDILINPQDRFITADGMVGLLMAKTAHHAAFASSRYSLVRKVASSNSSGGGHSTMNQKTVRRRRIHKRDVTQLHKRDHSGISMMRKVDAGGGGAGAALMDAFADPQRLVRGESSGHSRGIELSDMPGGGPGGAGGGSAENFSASLLSSLSSSSSSSSSSSRTPMIGSRLLNGNQWNSSRGASAESFESFTPQEVHTVVAGAAAGVEGVEGMQGVEGKGERGGDDADTARSGEENGVANNAAVAAATTTGERVAVAEAEKQAMGETVESKQQPQQSGGGSTGGAATDAREDEEEEDPYYWSNHVIVGGNIDYVEHLLATLFNAQEQGQQMEQIQTEFVRRMSKDVVSFDEAQKAGESRAHDGEPIPVRVPPTAAGEEEADTPYNCTRRGSNTSTTWTSNPIRVVLLAAEVPPSWHQIGTMPFVRFIRGTVLRVADLERVRALFFFPVLSWIVLAFVCCTPLCLCWR